MSVDLVMAMFFIVAIGVCVTVIITQQQLSILENRVVLQEREIKILKSKIKALMAKEE